MNSRQIPCAVTLPALLSKKPRVRRDGSVSTCENSSRDRGEPRQAMHWRLPVGRVQGLGADGQADTIRLNREVDHSPVMRCRGFPDDLCHA